MFFVLIALEPCSLQEIIYDVVGTSPQQRARALASVVRHKCPVVCLVSETGEKCRVSPSANICHVCVEP